MDAAIVAVVELALSSPAEVTRERLLEEARGVLKSHGIQYDDKHGVVAGLLDRVL